MALIWTKSGSGWMVELLRSSGVYIALLTPSCASLARGYPSISPSGIAEKDIYFC